MPHTTIINFHNTNNTIGTTLAVELSSSLTSFIQILKDYMIAVGNDNTPWANTIVAIISRIGIKHKYKVIDKKALEYATADYRLNLLPYNTKIGKGKYYTLPEAVGMVLFDNLALNSDPLYHGPVSQYNVKDVSDYKQIIGNLYLVNSINGFDNALYEVMERNPMTFGNLSLQQAKGMLLTKPTKYPVFVEFQLQGIPVDILKVELEYDLSVIRNCL